MMGAQRCCGNSDSWRQMYIKEFCFEETNNKAWILRENYYFRKEVKIKEKEQNIIQRREPRMTN